MPLSVFGYVVTDCTCIGTSLHLSFSLSQCPGILLVNLRVYVRLLIGISLSLFVSECVKQCPTILSLIVGVSQCTSLDSCCSLSFLSECFYPYSAILSLIVGVQLRLFIPICRPLFLCVFSVSEYIICNSYGCDQSRSARSLITVKDTVAHSESHACLRREQRYRKIIFSF